MKTMTRLGLVGMGVMLPVSALAQTPEPRVQSDDAHRFAAVFEAANGTPSAEQLQAGYLDGAGAGVEIFTPMRIQNAENLAAQIAQNPGLYQRGIEVCLPLADQANTDLQAVYAAMQPLFPGYELPEIHVVFGAGNSGGTAGPGALVLGLEVICRMAMTEEEINATYRFFFAHEAVHALQTQNAEAIDQDPLLYASLMEGMADYVSVLVTGEVPTQTRHDWALENEAMIWAEFARDRAFIQAEIEAGASFSSPSPAMSAAFRRWHWNAGSAPEGWPYELGYWMGRQIIADYVEGAEDPDSALIELLDIKDPIAILQSTSYFEVAGGQP